MRTRFLFAALALGATALPAQQPSAFRSIELRPFAGAYVPTGALKNVMHGAPVLGMQAAVEFKPTLHMVGTFAWIPGESKYPASDDAVNVYQYDLGVEWYRPRTMVSGIDFRPFLGIGGGARTYDYAATELFTKTGLVGYGAVGTELKVSSIGLRLEVRDYLAYVKSPLGDAARATRNDLRVTLGVAYHFR
jgi:hypothetical protein